MIEKMLADLPQPVARIVHIGAGTGTGLPACLASGAARILLVEADPDVAAQLAAETAQEPRVEVIAAAVSADLRPRPFYRTNFPELDSLRPPAAALKELFPGLKTLSRDPVTPADPVALLGDGPEAPGSQALVLETPGESLGLLQALEAGGLLHRFDAICLREGRQPLYEGAAAAAEIRGWLEIAGFAAGIEPQPEDPERPLLIARLDRKARAAQREIARLSAALDQAQAEAATLTEERDAARSQLAEGRAALETAGAEAGQLREAARKAEARSAGLAEEVKTLSQERDAARAEVDRLGELREAARKAEAARDQAEHRMRQSRDEMLKAEGQIRLLRDLLLNGPSL